MGLEDRLRKKTEAQRAAMKEMKAQESALALTPIRDRIQRKEQEKTELVRLGTELDSEYKEADRILASFKGKKEILQQLFDTYRVVLQEEGIETRTDILEADDYKEETEVTEYKAAVRALRDTVTKIVGLRKKIRQAFSDSDLILTSGKREEGQDAIQARADELEAEIVALTEQTPEGQTAKQERIGREYLEARAKRMSYNSTTPVVYTEDLRFADENGEERLTELLSEYCLRPTEAKIANEKKEMAYAEWERLREFPTKSAENRKALQGIYTLLETVAQEYQTYVDEDQERLKQIQRYGSKSAEGHLLHRLSLAVDRFNDSECHSVEDLEEKANGFERFLSDDYDQDTVANLFTQFSQRVEAYRSDFAAITPVSGEKLSLPERIESPKDVGQSSVFSKILEKKQREEDKFSYLRKYYAPKEQEWKERLDLQQAIIEIKLDRSIADGRLNEMGNELAILKKRIENIRRIENIQTQIQKSLNTLRERSAESFVSADVPEEYGWEEGEEQIIADHEAVIGDKAAGTGLWGAAAKKEKGGLMGLGKNLAGAQSDREDISKRQAIIDRMKAVKKKRRDDATKKERSRIETLTESIVKIAELISDTQDSGNGSPARTLVLDAQRMGAVSGAVSFLESKLKDILDAQPSSEEKETLTTYNALLDRRKTADENLQRLQK